MPDARLDTHTRRLTKVLRDVLRDDRPETLADATDALKYRLAKLRITATVDELGAALRIVDVKHRRQTW